MKRYNITCIISAYVSPSSPSITSSVKKVSIDVRAEPTKENGNVLEQLMIWIYFLSTSKVSSHWPCNNGDRVSFNASGKMLFCILNKRKEMLTIIAGKYIHGTAFARYSLHGAVDTWPLFYRMFESYQGLCLFYFIWNYVPYLWAFICNTFSSVNMVFKLWEEKGLKFRML